jgi:sigma-B regulation protein RsbU (phosphoserine phosphatase)
LLFYTDGVTEARDPQGGFFGDERLLAAARAGSGSAKSVLSSVSGAVAAFTAGAEQTDDVTIVVVQRGS